MSVMSLVTEALVSAGSLAKDDWSTKIDRLSGRAYDIKHELNDFIQQCYGDFVPLLTTTDNIHVKLCQLQADVESLQSSFDNVVKSQIRDSTKEFEKLSVEHLKTSKLTDALEKLYLIHTSLEGYEKNFKTKQFFEASTWLKEIGNTLSSLEGDDLVDTSIYNALRTKFSWCQQNLQYTLDEIWRDSIVWTLPLDDDTEGTGTHLSINFVNASDGVSGQDVVHSLMTCQTLSYKLQKFAKNVLQYLFEPVVVSSFSPVIKCEGAKAVIKLEKKICLTDSTQEFHPDIVFGKVLMCLEFLYNHLLNLKLSPGTDKDEVLMSLFRKYVCEDTIKLLIDHCLRKSIPNTKEELNNYDKVAAVVKQFESSLQSMHFIPEEVTQFGGLIDFISDIHVHFGNQRCAAVLRKARKLMKMDIHETVEITSDAEYNDETTNLLQSSKLYKPSELVVQAVTKILNSEMSLSENTMRLPRFRVSKAAKELIELAYQTLHEATTSSPESAMRMVITTQDVFELYAAVVPMYHRESLLNLPQVAALHHNDCWYISHHLLTLGHQFSKLLPGKSGGVELSFAHQVPMLRHLGSECFLAQMRKQRDLLLECLAPLKKFQSTPNVDKYMIAERPVKQVMHQLHHLRKVWSDILPDNVLQTSIATLVNSAISEVVSCICTMEDISSEDSIQLKTICCVLEDQIPSLFPALDSDDSTDVFGKRDLTWQRNVRKWQRLAELIFVLDASLIDIVDRWAHSKGPLASSFTAVEVKGLIRALFQNTERRANAISKIRY
ncbi:centromere/kinetochore protein zw10 homolog [Clavelina lepadiformis]|uniref:centromere/kinetochore protein zw10 homolog n=1 Tax=Clavelina lepadiformis TaxID=159417 RepID=UPI0040428AC6